ncbi:hypothetical protein PoB_001303700 [Plakobranchus ocellatus]|uniref:Uncharacterized protein n=1 Tax=Plakobranchus ocellatus TaxID=259542 RepID=A0AAV3YW21_9GAST|nr:hypothetical protein PoB_001303700 [Plakobranchus ocellatus]
MSQQTVETIYGLREKRRRWVGHKLRGFALSITRQEEEEKERETLEDTKKRDLELTRSAVVDLSLLAWVESLSRCKSICLEHETSCRRLLLHGSLCVHSKSICLEHEASCRRAFCSMEACVFTAKVSASSMRLDVGGFAAPWKLAVAYILFLQTFSVGETMGCAAKQHSDRSVACLN